MSAIPRISAIPLRAVARDTVTVGNDRSRWGGSGGFTIVELMIGLALVAILMGIGLPMFRSFILDQQLRSTASDLRIALSVARSEAVKRNRTIELLPLDEDDGWGSGWTIPSPVAADPCNPEEPDDSCLLVHRQGGDVSITTNPDIASLQFSPMGRATAEVEFEVDIGPPGSSVQGCLLLGLDGRIESTKGACTGG